MLLFLKKAQFLCGIIAVYLVFAPFASLKAQNAKDLKKQNEELQVQLKNLHEDNAQQKKQVEELENQYLWYSNYSRGTELRVQNSLKEELLKNTKFMSQIKEFIVALKMGYEDYKKNKPIQFPTIPQLFRNYSLDSSMAGIGVYQHSGLKIYPQFMIWTHKKDAVIIGDTVPYQLFSSYLNSINKRYKNVTLSPNDSNYMSHFLHISDTNPYRIELLLAAFKKDVSNEKSPEFIARYPAYTNDVKEIYSNNYVLTSRQWWNDFLDEDRRNYFEWTEGTDGDSFRIGLSRPFISSTGQNSLTERSLWFDIDLDSLGAKMVLTILLTRNEPNFVKTIPEPLKKAPRIKTVSTPIKQSKIALVIGNAIYTSVNKLFNPENDANAMETALKSLGFKVFKHTNLGQDSLDYYIKEFSYIASKGKYDVVLFYYSGHGASINNDNYLIPTNFPKNCSKTDFDNLKTLTVDNVLNNLSENDFKASTYILILDSCRDNPFPKTPFRPQLNENSWNPQNLRPNSEEKISNIIAYSTSLGQAACDGASGNGCYTSVLLKHIKDCKKSIGDMLTDVQTEMNDKYGQKPNNRNDLSLGNFYFNENCK